MPQEQQSPVRAVGQRYGVLWVIATLLAVIAVTLIARPDTIGSLGGTAFGTDIRRPYERIGAQGVYLYPIQIRGGTNRPERYGLTMLDVDASTIWVYEFVDKQAASKGITTSLELVAARTWIYDRELREFNTGGNGTSLRDIQRIVDAQNEKLVGADDELAKQKQPDAAGGQ